MTISGPLTELQTIQLNEEIANINKIAQDFPTIPLYEGSFEGFLGEVARYRYAISILDKMVFNLFSLMNRFNNQNFYNGKPKVAPSVIPPTLDDI